MEELEKERAEYLAGWQRAKADLLNYKKEEKERLQGFLQYANEAFLLKLLPIVDNLERAEKEVEKDNNRVVQGFLQIGKQLRDFLKKQGVEEMRAQGEKFDPEFHEAVGEAEGAKSGYIKEVVEKGYKVKDTLLRPAKVKVGK